MSESELSKYFLTKKVPYVKPLYTVDLKDKAAILDWFREADHGLGEYYRPLFREQKENMVFFLGSGINPNFASPFTATFATTSDLYAEPQQLYVNDMYRIVLDQVSLIVNNELIPDVLPNSEDYSDKVACNVVKEWIESMNYDKDFDLCRFRWEMQKKIFGEAFVIPMWNPEIGPLHPDAKEVIDEDLDLLDENGEVVLGPSNKPIKLRKNLRIGDVEYLNKMPWDILIDPQERYQDAQWFYWKDWLDVKYLQKKWPKYNWEYHDHEKMFDPFSNSEKDNPERRAVYYLYHKSNQFMPEGRMIIASKEYVMVNQPIKEPTIVDSQLLPLVRFVDLDIGYGVRGIPILFRNCKNIVDAYNRVSNQAYNNLEMESPKILCHQSAKVDAQRMPNGTVVIEWDGNREPKIVTPTTATSSLWNFREALKKNLDEMSLQTPMVRGDVVNSQMDSFVALQHFEDQRIQLATPDIRGHIKTIEHLYRLQISIARDNYKPEDGRLVKILGKHNSTQLKYFDPQNLSKAYDVKIYTTGNLANSKAARTQMMLSIKREFPEMISNETFLDALGLSHQKKFMNALTAAISSAEAENHDMMSGEDVLEPSRFEDLIAHWETHRIPMQTLDFKQSPPEIQDIFIRHVTATEKLMFEQAAESPMFLSRLQGLRQFPMFYIDKPVNAMAPMPEPGMELMPEPPPNAEAIPA